MRDVTAVLLGVERDAAQRRSWVQRSSDCVHQPLSPQRNPPRDEVELLAYERKRRPYTTP